MVNYNVKGTGLDITDEIRTYLEKKLSHVDTYLQNDPTKHVDVELQYQTSEDRKKFMAELTMTSEGALFRAEAFGDALHEAIDLATDDLTRELDKNKKKNKSLVRHGASRFKDFIRGFRKDV